MSNTDPTLVKKKCFRSPVPVTSRWFAILLMIMMSATMLLCNNSKLGFPRVVVAGYGWAAVPKPIRSLGLPQRSHRRNTPLDSRRLSSSSSSDGATATATDTVTATAAPSTTSTLLLSDTAPTALLNRSRQSKAFRNGNQLVFTRAVQEIKLPNKDHDNDVAMATLVQVAVAGADGSKKKKSKQTAKPAKQPQQHQPAQNTPAVTIGWGVYNPLSLYKIRILCHRYLQPALYQQVACSSSPQQAMQAVLKHHLETALLKRRALDLPNADTTMYRLVNGEGDGLSGLHVDVLNMVVVAQSSAAWCQVYRDDIIEVIRAVMVDHDVVWKVAQARLKQDGYYDNNNNELDSSSEATKDDDTSQEETTIIDESRPVLCSENGVQFQTYPYLTENQKTGVYCDQRDNRAWLARYCKDKRVLDLCCYHGGFGLTAIVNGGAASAVGVDSSAAAIDCATQNAILNHCQDRMEFHQSDITKYLQSTSAAQDETFDVVVLDPPKLAPTVAQLDKARRKYHGLNRDAIKVVSPKGGLFMTCSCSQSMTQADGGQYFLTMVAGAAQAAQRHVTLLQVSGAAGCHTQAPMALPTGAYLTAALFYVHPTETNV